jgi:homoserine kinase type II
VEPAETVRIRAGTATANYRITDRHGGRWFAKVYRDRDSLDLGRERAAIELAEFARAGGVPVPAVHRTREGALMAEGRVRMSLWEYVCDAETAEGGLTGARWQAVGTVLGRLHRHLATHPAAGPALRPGAGVIDVRRSRARFDRMIEEYGRHDRRPDPFEAWVLDAVRQRRALLDRATAIVARLPRLTEQMVHGDLASPNLMLRGDDVAAVIDFGAPRPRFLTWEIARIGCDPRTVLLGDQWLTGLAELVAAYREEHPAARVDDLLATATVACGAMLASTYPLAEPLDHPEAVDESLRAYARARHHAAFALLERLRDAEALLRDRLR